MNLLSLQSCKRLEKYYRFAGQISSYKIASFLSFYTDKIGEKVLYDKKLEYPASFQNSTQKQKLSLEEYLSVVNKDLLYSQSFLTGLFNNHILSLEQSNELLRNCVHLKIQNKKDIVNFIFGTNLDLNVKNWLQSFKEGNHQNFDLQFELKDKKFPSERKKNFFIVFENKITDFSILQNQILPQCGLLDVPNLSKILCLDLQVQDMRAFNDKLIQKQGFFKQRDIKIKNISADKVPKQVTSRETEKGFRIHKLLEYVSKNVRGNTLLHQLPQYYQFYKEAAESQDSSVQIYNKFTPMEIILFIQRAEWMANRNSKQQLSFQGFNKNFTYRFKKDPYYLQTSKGFIVSRYLTRFNKKKYEKLIAMQEKGKVNYASD